MDATSRLVTAVLVCCGTLAVAAAPGAGFNRSVSNVLVAPNGSYCCSCLQGLSELYVVEGLR